MKIKYYSDDGHEFESRSMCEKYENALDEIESIKGLPMKEVDGKEWFRVSSVAEFYFFDHMDDNTRQKSNRDMYKISQIVSKINHYFPYWITKDFDEGIMIDKKRVEVIDESIEFLEKKIERFKNEKKELEKLRSVEVTDDDYKFVMEKNTQPKQQPQVENTQPQQEQNQNNNKRPILGTNKYGKQGKFDIDGLEFEMSDIVAMAQDESGLTIVEWNELTEAERNNIIEEQIQVLKQA